MYGEVVSTERLTPQLVRVVLGGPGMDDYENADPTDSYVNCFFLPDEANYAPPFEMGDVRKLPREQRPFPRRMTVRAWDPQRHELTIDVAVHGDVGYAGRWAAKAKPGDRLQFRGPGGNYSPPADADSFLLVGDESALPAIARSAESVPPGKVVVVVVEVEDAGGEVGINSPADLEVHWVHRAGRDAVEDLLAEAVASLPRLAGVVSAFVHGEAAETRAVRRVLLGKQIVAPENLSCSPYWARGYDDEQWRAIKGDWVREMNAEVLDG